MPEAMGCTCMQRIPVRQSNAAGSCAWSVWGWDLRWTVIEPRWVSTQPESITKMSTPGCLSGPPYRRTMFRAASSVCSPVGSYRLSGKSLRAHADVCNVRALGAPPNPSSHLSQATRGLYGAVSYSEAVGRSFPPDGPIAQQPSSPAALEARISLLDWAVGVSICSPYPTSREPSASMAPSKICSFCGSTDHGHHRPSSGGSVTGAGVFPFKGRLPEISDLSHDKPGWIGKLTGIAR